MASMNRSHWRSMTRQTAALFVATLAASLATASTSSASRDPFNYAFKFASAIVSDPKDMGKAQEAVVWDLTSSGAWRDAEASAEKIEGWRRGTAYADLATALAKAGRVDDAKRMIAKAETFRPTIEGWQNLRIASHIAAAYAALGDDEKAKTLAIAVATEDAQQYGSMSRATIASGLAAKGQFDGAAGELDRLKDGKDLDDAWWRTVGYVDMSRQKSLSREERVKAIQSAREAAEGIPGWRKAEALESIADEFRKLGMMQEAREAVGAAQAILLALPDTMPIKAPLLSNCARSWAELGSTEKARSLLVQVESLAPKVQEIERPVVYANVASSFAAMKDTVAAKRLYGQALQEAAALVNARPRALAVVEICRSIGKSGVGLDDAMRARLDALYAGLKDPW
jgi:tetratricopeptide (TPR) repeat protein